MARPAISILRRFLPLSLSCAVVLLLASPPGAEALPVSTESLAFSVIRNGEEIGTHQISFSELSDRTVVDINTSIAVKVALVTVYRFEHKGQEIWSHDGHLLSLHSKTNDDGDSLHLDVENQSGALAISGNGTAWPNPPADTVKLGSLWNANFAEAHQLLDTLDGSPLAVTVADKGKENVSAHGQTIQAHHYSMTGDLERELWYDAQGKLVRLSLTADDKSHVDYVLK